MEKVLLFVLISLLRLCIVSSSVNFLTTSPNTLTGGAYLDYFTFTFTSDVNIASPVTVNGTSFFYGFAIQLASTTPVARTTTIWDPKSTSQGNGASLRVLFSSNQTNSTLPNMANCQPSVAVDSIDPTILRVTLVPTTATCNNNRGYLLQLTVPYTVLVPNPVRFSTVTLRMSTYFASNDLLTYQQDQSMSSNMLALPYSIAEKALQVKQLDFIFAAPSTSVLGERPSYWRFWFIPGVTLQSISGSPATIMIQSKQVIFTADPPNGLTFVVGNCTQSFANTRVINTSIAGLRTDSAVGSVLLITLGPVECVLTQNVLVQFDVPQGYLAALSGNPGYVDLHMATNEEPTMVRPEGYVAIGSNAVRSFKAVIPSTTQTMATPSLTVMFVLDSGLQTGSRIVLGSLVGVFRPNLQNVEIGFSPSCKGLGTTTANAITVVPDSACVASMAVGSMWNMTIPSAALLPNLPAGTHVLFTLRTSEDPADTLLEAYNITQACNVDSISGTFTANAKGSLGFLSTFTVEQRAELVNYMTEISPVSTGSASCENLGPYVWLFKIQEAADARNVTAPKAPTIIVTNWGFMWTTPVFVVAITYPLTTTGLWDKLKLSFPDLTSLDSIAFVVSIDRMLRSGMVVNSGNPLAFEVPGLKYNIINVLVFTSSNVSGVAVQGNIGRWEQGKSGNLMVYSLYGPVFIGYQKVVVHEDDDSDDALFGLLALLAIPLLCLGLLAFLAFRFWPRESGACACPANFHCQPQPNFNMMQPMYSQEFLPSYRAPFPHAAPSGFPPAAFPPAAFPPTAAFPPPYW